MHPRIRVRQALRLTSVATHLAWGFAIVLVAFPWISQTSQRAIQQRWSRRMLTCLGVRMAVHGAEQQQATAHAPQQGLLVSNHVSWLDIFVINSVARTSFVCKSEVRDWPGIGFLCAKTGTVFIERGSRSAARRVNQTLVEMLGRGEQITVFPEGTTGDGAALLTFRAALLQSAIDAAGMVQPLALQYLRHDAASSRALPAAEFAYCGETTLWQSLCAIAAAEGVTARLAVLREIPAVNLTRRELAEQTQAKIHAALLQTASIPRDIARLDEEVAAGAAGAAAAAELSAGRA